MKTFEYNNTPKQIVSFADVEQRWAEGNDRIVYVDDKGHKLVLEQKKDKFAIIGEVEYYVVFYGEKASENEYNVSHSQFFPVTKQNEAFYCFVDRVCSASMFWYSDNFSGYTLKAIKQGVV